MHSQSNTDNICYEQKQRKRNRQNRVNLVNLSLMQAFLSFSARLKLSHNRLMFSMRSSSSMISDMSRGSPRRSLYTDRHTDRYTHRHTLVHIHTHSHHHIQLWSWTHQTKCGLMLFTSNITTHPLGTWTPTITTQQFCCTEHNRDVMEPAKIRMQMQISCANSVGCGCRFVARLRLVPAVIATVIQLNYLKLNSYKQISSE